jgi:hypothetical protein
MEVKNHDDEDDAFAGAEFKTVMAKSGFIPGDTLEKLSAARSYVVPIYRSDGKRGTGSFVAQHKEDTFHCVVVMTSNHVLPDAATASRAHYKLGMARFKLFPDVFFVTDKDLGFTFVAAVPPFGYHALVQFLPPSAPMPGHQSQLFLLQFPSASDSDSGDIGWSSGAMIASPSDADPNCCHYQVTTEYGISGAPVFDANGFVISLYGKRLPLRHPNGGEVLCDLPGSDALIVFQPGVHDKSWIVWKCIQGTGIHSITSKLRLLGGSLDSSHIHDRIFKSLLDRC